MPWPFRRKPTATPPAAAGVGAAQWQRVEAALPFLDRLDAADRRRLRELALRFLDAKEFHGAHGLEVSDQARLSIALQACLPILQLGLAWYDDWTGIVVYPGEFVVQREYTDEAGVVHTWEDSLAGEAWEGGPVLISWADATDFSDGMAIVIHEFAHKLDMRDGTANGIPRLHEGMRRADWAAAFNAAYEDFCERVDADEDTAIDPYAAESPAEFFAVLSETFFIDPELLAEDMPAVYEQLRLFYRQDPLAGADTPSADPP